VPKLFIWDLRNNSLVHMYAFPDSVASYNASFLNDLVIDTERNVAYIADAGRGVVLSGEIHAR
jgi:hypothetical protein